MLRFQDEEVKRQLQFLMKLCFERLSKAQVEGLFKDWRKRTKNHLDQASSREEKKKNTPEKNTSEKNIQGTIPE